MERLRRLRWNGRTVPPERARRLTGIRRAINETSPKPEARDVSETVIGRATNSFNMSIKAYGKGKANTAFPLEAGETVTIKASYTPFSAGVDFGLMLESGEMGHSESGENGQF